MNGDDQATWRRLRVVPFDVVITEAERDPMLAEKLQLDADAVLAWAVQGWNAYEDNGDQLREPAGVLAATNWDRDMPPSLGHHARNPFPGRLS